MNKNYHLVPNCIYDDGLSVYDIAVYGYLARCADQSYICFPSRTTISKVCKISIRSVDKAIKNLEEYGYVHKTVRRKSDGTNMSNVYTLNKME